MPRRTNLFSQVAKELKKPLLVAKPTKPSHLLRNLFVLAVVATAVVAAIMFMKKMKKKGSSSPSPTPSSPPPPPPLPQPSGPFYSKLYSGDCGDDKKITRDIRVGVGGHTIPICAKPSTKDFAISQVAAANKYGCEQYNTNGVTGWKTVLYDNGPGKMDLRAGVGGTTLRLCYRQVQGEPGRQAHIDEASATRRAG